MEQVIVLGKIAFTPGGVWDPEYRNRENEPGYDIFTFVNYGTSSYVSIVNGNTSVPGEDPQKWMFLADGRPAEAAADRAKRVAQELIRLYEDTTSALREIANEELARIDAEENRAEAERAREHAEDLRESGELQREQEEEARKAAERARDNKESERESKESLRVEAELGRVRAEQQRLEEHTLKLQETDNFLNDKIEILEGLQEDLEGAKSDAELALHNAELKLTEVDERMEEAVAGFDGRMTTAEAAISYLEKCFGKYEGRTDVTLSVAKSGKYINAATATEVSDSNYSISAPFHASRGDLLLVPSKSPVGLNCSVVAQMVTNTFDKVIKYTNTYDAHGRISTAKADYNNVVYTAQYDDEESQEPSGWVAGGVTYASLPSSHSATTSHYVPMVRQSVAELPAAKCYTIIVPEDMDIVVSAYNETVAGGVASLVGWEVIKNIVANFVGLFQQRVIAEALCSLSERIAGAEDMLQNGFATLRVDELMITRRLEGLNIDGNFSLQGAGAPAATVVPANWDYEKYGEWKGIPQFISQIYTDTTNKIAYIATGITGVADWKRMTNA